MIQKISPKTAFATTALTVTALALPNLALAQAKSTQLQNQYPRTSSTCMAVEDARNLLKQADRDQIYVTTTQYAKILKDRVCEREANEMSRALFDLLKATQARDADIQVCKLAKDPNMQERTLQATRLIYRFYPGSPCDVF